MPLQRRPHTLLVARIAAARVGHAFVLLHRQGTRQHGHIIERVARDRLDTATSNALRAEIRPGAVLGEAARCRPARCVSAGRHAPEGRR
ncbi:MAG: hypothetical protein R3D03_13400 [Geminicoccaceae bacterium]